jgi:hypothetical protein
MRPIEIKVLKRIEKDGLTFDGVEEIIDGTNRQELKKSFPDECHFQTSRFFAKTVIDSLLRCRLIKKEGNKFLSIKHTEKKEEEK